MTYIHGLWRDAHGRRPLAVAAWTGALERRARGAGTTVAWNDALGAWELCWRGSWAPRTYETAAAARRDAARFDWFGGMVV